MTTAEQRQAALDRANDVRSRRARLKRDIAAQRTDLRPYLLDPPWYLQTMEVYDLIKSLRYAGAVRATLILRRCAVSPHRELGNLTQAERRRVAAAVREQLGGRR